MNSEVALRSEASSRPKRKRGREGKERGRVPEKQRARDGDRDGA